MRGSTSTSSTEPMSPGGSGSHPPKSHDRFAARLRFVVSVDAFPVTLHSSQIFFWSCTPSAAIPLAIFSITIFGSFLTPKLSVDTTYLTVATPCAPVLERLRDAGPCAFDVSLSSDLPPGNLRSSRFDQHATRTVYALALAVRLSGTVCRFVSRRLAGVASTLVSKVSSVYHFISPSGHNSIFLSSGTFLQSLCAQAAEHHAYQAWLRIKLASWRNAPRLKMSRTASFSTPPASNE